MRSDKIKANVFLICLLFVSLYVIFGFMVYFSPWYTFNYELQNTYKGVEREDAKEATYNLVSFFKYGDELNEMYWSQTERWHMSDVRNIYLVLFFLALISASMLEFLAKKTLFRDASRKNLFILPIILLVILPIFSFFWLNIFHPLLFSNDYWMYTIDDISYYLFPEAFFIRSLLLLVGGAFVINGVIYLVTKKKA